MSDIIKINSVTEYNNMWTGDLASFSSIIDFAKVKPFAFKNSN